MKVFQVRRANDTNDRVFWSKVITTKKEDTGYNLQINTPAKSLKGVLLLFVKHKPYSKPYSSVNEVFYNSNIEKVAITLVSEVNELYLHAMLPRTTLIVNFFENHNSKVTIRNFMNKDYVLFFRL